MDALVNDRAVIGSNSGARARCIFRAHGDRGYTKLKNSMLQDKRLSDETRGLIARLLSLPEDWEVTVQSIIASGKAGRDKVYRMIKEAEQYGYIKADERSRSSKGKFDRQLYLVSDDPEALIERAAEEFLQLEERRNIDVPIGGDGKTYVYVLKRGDLVKVGVSQEPKKRVLNINYTSGEAPAEPCFFHPSTHWEAQFIERGAHLKLSHSHVEGEWFRCSPDEAIYAIKLAASHPLTDFPDVGKVAVSKEFDPRPDYPYTASPCPGEPYPENPDAYKRNIYNNTPPIVPPTAEPEKPKRSKDAIPDEYPHDFEAFWKIYPRREGKAAAFKVWKKLTITQKRRAYSALKKQLDHLRSKLNVRGENVCPHPRTWLYQGRFDDDPGEPPPPSRPKTKDEMTATELQAYYDRGGV